MYQHKAIKDTDWIKQTISDQLEEVLTMKQLQRGERKFKLQIHDVNIISGLTTVSVKGFPQTVNWLNCFVSVSGRECWSKASQGFFSLNFISH